MRPFVPKRVEQVAFGFLLTCFMTFIVSGIATFLAIQRVDAGFASLWFTAWMSSWAVAFPSVLVVAPLVRRILRRIVIDG
ncbi:DUF2798 domain-containing protein [Mesorhizobium sp. CAU 1741]|uniref:DUF2798 domain-containing protein n=1 Tax=Mesorhizobium sp. CAU 1741 TaxID=3140366 RepID=UPI00325BE0A0